MKVINLLPEAEIKELKLELASKHFISFFSVIIIALVILVVAGFCAKILVNSEIAVSDQQISQLQSQLNSSDNQALQKEIISLNQQIKNVKTINTQHYDWSVALIELANLSPQDFHYDLVTFDRTTKQIEVAGTADQRSSVLDFWSSVKKSTVFSNIDFPLNNLEKPTDTPFTFTFTINPSALTTKTQ